MSGYTRIPLSDATAKAVKSKGKPYRLSDGRSLFLLIRPDGGKDRGSLTAPHDGWHLGQWRADWGRRAASSSTWERAVLAYTSALEIEQDARSEAEEAAKNRKLTPEG